MAFKGSIGKYHQTFGVFVTRASSRSVIEKYLVTVPGHCRTNSAVDAVQE
jgi:hypothetical protein